MMEELLLKEARVEAAAQLRATAKHDLIGAAHLLLKRLGNKQGGKGPGADPTAAARKLQAHRYLLAAASEASVREALKLWPGAASQQQGQHGKGKHQHQHHHQQQQARDELFYHHEALLQLADYDHKRAIKHTDSADAYQTKLPESYKLLRGFVDEQEEMGALKALLPRLADAENEIKVAVEGELSQLSAVAGVFAHRHQQHERKQADGVKQVSAADAVAEAAGRAAEGLSAVEGEEGTKERATTAAVGVAEGTAAATRAGAGAAVAHTADPATATAAADTAAANAAAADSAAAGTAASETPAAAPAGNVWQQRQQDSAAAATLVDRGEVLGRLWLLGRLLHGDISKAGFLYEVQDLLLKLEPVAAVEPVKVRLQQMVPLLQSDQPPKEALRHALKAALANEVLVNLLHLLGSYQQGLKSYGELLADVDVLVEVVEGAVGAGREGLGKMLHRLTVVLRDQGGSEAGGAGREAVSKKGVQLLQEAAQEELNFRWVYGTGCSKAETREQGAGGGLRMGHSSLHMVQGG